MVAQGRAERGARVPCRTQSKVELHRGKRPRRASRLSLGRTCSGVRPVQPEICLLSSRSDYSTRNAAVKVGFLVSGDRITYPNGARNCQEAAAAVEAAEAMEPGAGSNASSSADGFATSDSAASRWFRWPTPGRRRGRNRKLPREGSDPLTEKRPA